MDIQIETDDIKFLEKKVLQSLRIYFKIIDRKEATLKIVEEKINAGPGAFTLALFRDLKLNKELFAPMLRCIYDEQRFVRILAAATDGYQSNMDKAVSYFDKFEKQLQQNKSSKDFLTNLRILKNLTLLFKENFSKIQERLSDQQRFLRNPTSDALAIFLESWKKDIKLRADFLKQFSKQYSKIRQFVEMLKTTDFDDIKKVFANIKKGAVLSQFIALPAGGILYALHLIAPNPDLALSMFVGIQAIVLGFDAFIITQCTFEEQKEKAEMVLANRLATQLGIR